MSTQSVEAGARLETERPGTPVFTGPRPRITQWVNDIRERTREVTNPEQVRMIELLIEHLEAEDQRDVPRTMRTIATDGVYHSWGGTNEYTATAAEQERLYTELLSAWPNSFDLTMEIERLFVGRDGVCMDGMLHKEVTGEALEGMGHEVPPDASRSDRFVVSRRHALFVSYVDGLMLGEDLYRDERAVITRLVP